MLTRSVQSKPLQDRHHIKALDSIDLLKREILDLSELQAEALSIATIGGMTPDEAQEFELRRVRITRLTKQLSRLSSPA